MTATTESGQGQDYELVQLVVPAEQLKQKDIISAGEIALVEVKPKWVHIHIVGSDRKVHARRGKEFDVERRVPLTDGQKERRAERAEQAQRSKKDEARDEANARLRGLLDTTLAEGNDALLVATVEEYALVAGIKTLAERYARYAVCAAVKDVYEDTRSEGWDYVRAAEAVCAKWSRDLVRDLAYGWTHAPTNEVLVRDEVRAAKARFIAAAPFGWVGF